MDRELDLENLYPTELDFQYVTREYTSGFGYPLKAGIARRIGSVLDDYDALEETVIVLDVMDDEGHRARVFTPQDISAMYNGLRETRDTHNNCKLCFNKISHYTGSRKRLNEYVQIRTHDPVIPLLDADRDPYVSISSISHCNICHDGITDALDELVENASEHLVLSKL